MGKIILHRASDRFPFDIVVYNGDKKSPPHAYLERKGEKLYGFLITKNPPKIKKDISSYKCEINHALKEMLVDWAWKKTQEVKNWDRLKEAWN